MNRHELYPAAVGAGFPPLKTGGSMKRSTILFLSTLTFALISGPSVGADLPARTKLTHEQRMALLEKAGAIGPQHRQISTLAGDWNVTASLWSEPGQAPAVETGTSTFATVLGGRHLRQDLRLSLGGQPFEGIGHIGYDNVSGEYFSSWMDSSFTGAMLAHGTYDAATDTYTFHGSQPDPTSETKLTPVREVLHVLDSGHFTYEYYELRDGMEAIAVRLDYRRAQ